MGISNEYLAQLKAVEPAQVDVLVAPPVHIGDRMQGPVEKRHLYAGVLEDVLPASTKQVVIM